MTSFAREGFAVFSQQRKANVRPSRSLHLDSGTNAALLASYPLAVRHLPGPTVYEPGPICRKEDGLRAVLAVMPKDTQTARIEFKLFDGGLLHAELDRYGQVHGDGFAVQAGWLIFPLVQRVHGSLVQQRGSADHFHRGDFTGSVNQRIDSDIAADVLGSGNHRIDRRNGFEQLRGFDVAANGNRIARGRWAGGGSEIGTEVSIRRGRGIVQSDGRVGIVCRCRVLRAVD